MSEVKTMTYYYNTELNHHGILGQKWGIRRFQNADGSYTEEGKRRKRSDSYSDDYKKYRELKKKDPRTMSNNELKELNKRAQLEQDYRRLNPSTIAKGIAIIGAIYALSNTVNNLLDTGNKLTIKGKNYINKVKGG